MASSRFRFGLFEFDTANRELRRDGLLVRLQAQPSQILECLVQRAGEVVSREELQRVVWGDGTFVDFDRGLNFAMAQIRSALGDEASEPRFIRTIPKRGYQFIAPIEEMPGAEPEPAQLIWKRRNFSGVRLAAGIFAGLLLVAAAFAVGYGWRSRQGAAQTPIVAVARFSNETGDASLVSFSDALTDNVVERLTTAGSDGHFQVIGNAQILRRSREELDLKGLESSLGAKYLVLGQVLRNGNETRVLVHLIRLSDQTHLWVVRLDRTLTDPFSLESEVAGKVATEFSPRIVKDARGIVLPPAPSQ